MFKYLVALLLYFNIQVFGLNTTIGNVTSGNELWFSLVQNCKEPTVSCIRDTIHDFLKDTFDYDQDVHFTNFLKFSKNNFIYKDVDNETATISEDLHNESPFEEISRSLRENSKKFFMTHDIEVSLPEEFFLGSTLKVSPRSFDTNSTFFKVELVPKDFSQSVGQGRIFKNLLGNLIKKFITDRLLYALLAVLVIIKLLAVNVLFFLPSMLGVVTAKKIIVKILLFFFPALHHLFKLCAYTPYGTKHHIHKHQIAHIHQVAPGYYHHKPHIEEHHYHKPHIEEAEYSHDDSHHFLEDHDDSHYHHSGPPPDVSHYPEFANKDDSRYGDSYPAASYGNELFHKSPDDNDADPWDHTNHPSKPFGKKRMTATEIENMVLKAEKEALIKSRLQKERLRIHKENLKLQEQLNTAIKMQQKLKYHAALVGSKKNPDIKNSHLLTPLIPPPPPAATNQYPKSQFIKSPDSSFLIQHEANSQPGEFAEPPMNYVPTEKFVTPATSYLEQIKPSQSLEVQSALSGNGLPGKTIQAIQSYLKKKVSHNEQNIYPVYPSNQAQLSATPENKTVNSFQSPNVALSRKSAVVSQTIVASDRKSDQLSPEEEFYKAASITYDAFYSPILEKIDAILNGLKFNEEPCRERLICSMYKKPEKFSPHSNLISVELSRDQKELQKPKATNAAVIRFYKYVQAARDGQDQKDCIRLYPTCSVNTEI
ncbi:uncharacterized protein LOC130444685 [Diorhabda sublineata]|uniref:uncharacterized protein LOC130444685 n=1 Tax=Diorhabda sublineata TaxID=1163346 RepID=UPI0024E0C0C5|nr:uncharacterized protein LOC130444685 [Diorhabda sublineata]